MRFQYLTLIFKIKTSFISIIWRNTVLFLRSDLCIIMCIIGYFSDGFLTRKTCNSRSVAVHLIQLNETKYGIRQTWITSLPPPSHAEFLDLPLAVDSNAFNLIFVHKQYYSDKTRSIFTDCNRVCIYYSYT